MFKFSIGSCALENYVADKNFKISAEPVSGSDEFECYDGTIISSDSGKIIKLNIKLERVPFGVAETVSSLTAGAEFSVSFNYPYELTEMFTCESYQASGRNKGQLWDISLSLKSKAAIGGNCL